MKPVMAGLDPAIHESTSLMHQIVDARPKAGHDGDGEKDCPFVAVVSY
jgi:hypothetical protein